MFYYYVIPTFLTLVFLASYWLVHVLLMIFDALNFFWDWWDSLKRGLPFLPIIEFLIIGGFIYYIVKWELSGTP